MRTIGTLVMGAALAAAMSVGAATGQTAKPAPVVPVVGLITTIGDSDLTVARSDGTVVTLKLDDKTRYTKIVPLTIDDIKPNAYVGIGAKAGSDGVVTAVVVTVFPESSRGAGEGSRPWNQGADSTMTNGTVQQVVATNGHTVTVTYNGGQQQIAIPDGTPINGFELVDKSALVSGAPVLVRATQTDVNTFTAVAVNIGSGGYTPKG